MYLNTVVCENASQNGKQHFLIGKYYSFLWAVFWKAVKKLLATCNEVLDCHLFSYGHHYAC